MTRTRLLFIAIVVCAARPVVSEERIDYARDIRPVLKTYCFQCHGEAKQKAEINLEALDAERSFLRHFKLWKRVRKKLDSREMPPEKNIQPTDRERLLISNWLQQSTQNIDWSKVKHAGHITLPRLSHVEYSNSLRDLLNWNIDLADRFPDDVIGQTGFSTDRDDLAIRGPLLERYLDVADSVLNEFVRSDSPVTTTKIEAENFKTNMTDHPKWGQMIGNDEHAIHTYFVVENSGYYELTVRAWHYRKSLAHLTGMRVLVNDMPAAETAILATQKKPGDYKVLVKLSEGRQKISIARSTVVATEEEFRLPRPPKPEFTNRRTAYDFNPYIAAAIDYIEIKGPLKQLPSGALTLTGKKTDSTPELEAQWQLMRLTKTKLQALEKVAESKARAEGVKYKKKNIYDQLLESGLNPYIVNRFNKYYVPPSNENDTRPLPDKFTGTIWLHPFSRVKFTPAPDSHHVFTAKPGLGLVSKQLAAKIILKQFASRAFRRRVTDVELDQLLGPCNVMLKEGKPFRSSVQSSLLATLVSPHFLFRPEQGPVDEKDHKLTPYELASRLSYFLWMSIPDDELTKAAADGRLVDDEVLLRQIDRMLKDSKSTSFTQQFPRQWLGYYELGRNIQPSSKVFPEFTDDLVHAMIGETDTFFRQLIIENRPLTDLIDSDYTYLNETLSKHYGIGNVHGDRFLKVPTRVDRGGGVLGMASVLTTSSSHPARTSPVSRGNWILLKLFGEALPEPPNVPPLPREAGTATSKLSFRESFELHRRDPSCAACHRRIDPLGFGLENYDSLGRWRTTIGGKPIEASGVLPTGEAFASPSELRAVLMKKKDQIMTNIIRQMMKFALGRELEYYDEPVVMSILIELKKNGYRSNTLIRQIVLSYPFQHKNRSKDATHD